jgi:hypothetical protein
VDEERLPPSQILLQHFLLHSPSTRSLIYYLKVPEPEADGFIWCSINQEFKLEMEKTSQGEKSGES